MVRDLKQTSKTRLVVCLAYVAVSLLPTVSMGQQSLRAPAERIKAGNDVPRAATPPGASVTASGFRFSDAGGQDATQQNRRQDEAPLSLTIDGRRPSHQTTTVQTKHGFSFVQPGENGDATPVATADDWPTARKVQPLRSLLEEPTETAPTPRPNALVQRRSLQASPLGRPTPNTSTSRDSQSTGRVSVAEFAPAMQPVVSTPEWALPVPTGISVIPTVEETAVAEWALPAAMATESDQTQSEDAAIAEWAQNEVTTPSSNESTPAASEMASEYWMPNEQTLAEQESSSLVDDANKPSPSDETPADHPSQLALIGPHLLWLPTTLNASLLSQPSLVAESKANVADEIVAAPVDVFMPVQAGPEIVYTNVGIAKPENASLVELVNPANPTGPLRPSRPAFTIPTTVTPVPAQHWTPESSMVAPGMDLGALQTAALFDDDLRSFSGGPTLAPADDNTAPATPAQADVEARNSTGTREDGTIGEAPKDDDQELLFLRRQTILLEPGEFQFDASLTYLNDQSDFPVLLSDGVNFGVAEGKVRQRLLAVPLELRVGIAKYTQGFVNVPFGWSNSEVSFNGIERTQDEGGIGDVSAGLTQQVVIGNEYYPDVLANVAFSAPTGNSSVTTALNTPGSSLGQGVYTLSASLSFIQTIDPVVFFYGAGYTFRFQSTFADTIKIDPGDQVFYRFGAGFAINPHVTLSAAFTGSVIGRDEVNRRSVAGSIREPMSLRLAATISQRKNSKTHKSFKIVEPYVNFGLNEDSIDTFVGITWTH